MKKWWKSKTLWFNALISALAALEAVTQALQPFVGQHFYQALLVVLPVGNAVLRVVSNTALTK